MRLPPLDAMIFAIALTTPSCDRPRYTTSPIIRFLISSMHLRCTFRITSLPLENQGAKGFGGFDPQNTLQRNIKQQIIHIGNQVCRKQSTSLYHMNTQSRRFQRRLRRTYPWVLPYAVLCTWLTQQIDFSSSLQSIGIEQITDSGNMSSHWLNQTSNTEANTPAPDRSIETLAFLLPSAAGCGERCKVKYISKSCSPQHTHKQAALSGMLWICRQVALQSSSYSLQLSSNCFPSVEQIHHLEQRMHTH